MNTIKKLILFLTLICVLVFTMSTAITKEIYKKVLFDNTYQTALGSLRQIEFNLKEKRENTSQSIIKILTGDSLKRLAYVNDVSSALSYKEVNDFNKEILGIINYSEEIASILYVNQDGYMVGTDGKTVWREPAQSELKEQMKEILQKKETEMIPVWLGGFQAETFYKNKKYLRKPEENYITAVIPCKFSQNPLKEGILITNIKEEAFRSIFSATTEKNRGEIYIMDADGQIISSTRNDLIQTKYPLLDKLDTTKKEQYFTQNGVYAISYEIPSMKWWVVWERPMDSFYSEANQLYRILIYFVFLSLLIVLAFYGVYTKFLLKPLHTLIQGMEDVGKGKYGVEIKETDQGEIGQVIKSFNTMSKDIEVLTRENIRVNNEKRTLQLLALQEQMSPHFVLNALNTIKWMATIAKEKNIVSMVISLSKIIYAFKNTSAFETLGKEIDFVKNYIIVMNYRYGDVICVYYEIEEKLLNIPIPIFFIQPLVENSLKHGFEATNCQGNIKIYIREENGTIVIRVTDDGSGITREKREELNEKLERTNQSPLIDTGGVGLINIAKRIQIYYGSKYGIKIEEALKGTEVVITLPYNQKSGDGSASKVQNSERNENQ